MPANGRFGGHMVLGHVDGTGTIESIRPEADFSWVTVSYPAALAPYLIHRGSIAVDGISLTIAKLEKTTFDVQIVPFTWSHTNLRGARAGDRVNLECDMVGKYVSVRCALEVDGGPEGMSCTTQDRKGPQEEQVRSRASRTPSRRSAPARSSSSATTRIARTKAT